MEQRQGTHSLMVYLIKPENLQMFVAQSTTVATGSTRECCLKTFAFSTASLFVTTAEESPTGQACFWQCGPVHFPSTWMRINFIITSHAYTCKDMYSIVCNYLSPSSSTPIPLGMGVQGLQPSPVPSSGQLGRLPSLYWISAACVGGVPQLSFPSGWIAASEPDSLMPGC